jgi:MFS transporter, FHS family, glucose/mannose:H+ symporter
MSFSAASRLRASIALILVYMIYAVLLNSVGTVILQSILSFGITKPEGSILEACKDLSIATVSFFVASFVPRLGYRRALIVSLVTVAVACFAMRFFPGFDMTKILFLVIGVTFALVKVGVYASIGLLHTDTRAHASFTSLVESFFMVAVLSGTWLFSAFIDPVNPASLSWLNAYILIGGAGLLVALLWGFTPLPPVQAAEATLAEKKPWYNDLRAIPELFVAKFLVAFLSGIFLYVLLEQSLGSWLPTYNSEVLHLPAQMSVQASGLFAAALALGRLAGGVVLRRLSWPVVLAGCVIGTGLVILASIVFTPVGVTPASGWSDAPFQVFILPMAGFFFAPIYPTLNSIVLSALPQNRQAAMTGLIIAFSALGGTLGSFITGQIFSHFGGHTAFSLTLVPVVLLGFCLVLLQRRLGGDKP